MPADKLDLLVVSRSCFTAVNRLPYRELAERGLRVGIVVPSELTFGAQRKRAEPVAPGDPPLYALEATDGHGRLWTFRGMQPLLKQTAPSVVLLDTDPGSRLSMEVGVSQRARSSKTACISCDNMPRSFQGELRKGQDYAARLLMVRGLSMLASPLVDHVFCLTSDIVEVNEQKGFRNRTSIMRLGFDPLIFYPDEPARAARREELSIGAIPCIGYFGRIAPEKGLHVLLAALELLLDLDWVLLLDSFSTYRSAYADEMQARLKQRLGGRVRQFDADHRAIASYMNAADITVVPSVSSATGKEQYGRVVPESMACGSALIVSDSGALPELAGDAAVIVPENSPGALAEALRTLLADVEQRRSWSQRSIARAREFTIARQADQLEAVIRPWLRN